MFAEGKRKILDYARKTGRFTIPELQEEYSFAYVEALELVRALSDAKCVELSEDGRVWNTIAEPVSSGKTEFFEPYDMLGTPARYVRFTNIVNSRGDKWVSLSDVRIYPYGPGNKIEIKDEDDNEE